ncbi:MAG: GerMN domain-containing protein [Clostridia bacterium]|nr:GerMN domain-containing protein [Clostridia bacterium]
MKKRFCLILLCLAALLLSACAQQPPESLKEETPPGAQVIEAAPQEEAALQFTATLYFRHGETGLLRQESRQITMLPNESRERALISALLEGSRLAGSRPLFPERTEVLSTQAQDGVIYVTFNEALYDRYSDEDTAREDSILRRQLAMAALTATLTESGEYRAVQVLVRAEENVGRSMRLTDRFFWAEDDRIVEPLTRGQDSLPTPAAYAREMLQAWQNRDQETLAAFAAYSGGGRPQDWLAELPALLSFAVYDGTVSPDNARAVVCADLILRDTDGMEIGLDACPILLVRENGAWMVSLTQLRAIMGESNE